MSKNKINADIFEVVEKPKKKKREISAETKARLLENLKKGRETSKINRRKNKLAKEIKKREKVDERDKTIKDDMLKNVSYEDMKKEIEELKKQLNTRQRLETVKEEEEGAEVDDKQSVKIVNENNKISSVMGKGIAQPDEPINNKFIPLRERNINKPIPVPTDEMKNISLFNTDTFY
tara:strand:+ start:660 stop:1190 length:531 start_codon:yes stop_codon:yes gene_type:complete